MFILYYRTIEFRNIGKRISMFVKGDLMRSNGLPIWVGMDFGVHSYPPRKTLKGRRDAERNH
jgi:hypothetical protein